MKTWNVTITETLARTVTVEAEDAAGAEGIVRGMHDRGEIMLAAEDMRGTEITADREGICGPSYGKTAGRDGSHVIGVDFDDERNIVKTVRIGVSRQS